jgi:hypothetical protein
VVHRGDWEFRKPDKTALLEHCHSRCVKHQGQDNIAPESTPLHDGHGYRSFLHCIARFISGTARGKRETMCRINVHQTTTTAAYFQRNQEANAKIGEHKYKMEALCTQTEANKYSETEEMSTHKIG